MSAADSADVVIEMDAVNGELTHDFAALECPTVFVVGTGGHSGATEREMRTVRGVVGAAEASNPRVSVFATTPRKHTQILSKAPDTVVAAIEDVIRQSSS
jgi:dihydrodipicolinate reductase